jgi:predicted small metal-binding protein
MHHSEPAELHRALMDHIHRTHDNTIRDVATAINPTRIR